MICRLNNLVFHITEPNKLGVITIVTYIEPFRGTNEEYVRKYKPLYPNDSIREYNIGQGITPFNIHMITENMEYKNNFIIENRNDIINGLL